MNDYEVSRRQFAKSAAAIAAAFGISNFEVPELFPVAHAGSDPVKWAMIGTGTRALDLLRPLSTISNGQCVALCDIYKPNIEKAAKTIGGNPTLYEDYHKVLDRKDVEAVMIVTPLDRHAVMTLDALNAGKHVFCEKTMVFNEAEIKAVRDAVAAHPKQAFQVGLQRRYSQIYRMGMEMIKRGALGKVTHVYAHWNRNSDWRRPVADPKLERQINWRMYKEYSGGLMAELGSHQMDIAAWAFGSDPRSVMGQGGIDYWKDGREVYDNVQVIYEYPGGQKAVFTSMLNNTHYEFGEHLLGDAGTMELTLMGSSGTGQFWVEPKAKASTTGGKETWLAGATVSASGAQKAYVIFPEEMSESMGFVEKEKAYTRRWMASHGWYDVVEPKNPVGTQLEHFLTCCREGQKTVADINVGSSDAETVIYANLAMDEDRRVYWPKYRDQTKKK
jgi:predicted dehydrogenase